MTPFSFSNIRVMVCGESPVMGETSAIVNAFSDDLAPPKGSPSPPRLGWYSFHVEDGSAKRAESPGVLGCRVEFLRASRPCCTESKDFHGRRITSRDAFSQSNQCVRTADNQFESRAMCDNQSQGKTTGSVSSPTCSYVGGTHYCKSWRRYAFRLALSGRTCRMRRRNRNRSRRRQPPPVVTTWPQEGWVACT